MEKQMKIPEFTTLEDMAQFWDSHEITEFEDELREVREPIFDHLQRRAIIVMLDAEQYTLLNSIAEQEHLNAMSLVHEWVVMLIEQKGKMAVGQ